MVDPAQGVVIGVHLWDADGGRYLDMRGAYAAQGFGQCHSAPVAALVRQAKRRNSVASLDYRKSLRHDHYC